MRGIFNPAYFNLGNSVDPPSQVLTTMDAGPMTQYSFQRASHDELLVTISSPEPLNSSVVSRIFKNGGVSILDHCWKAAYPAFKPIDKLPPTRLDERLMYLNAMEPSVSSLETSALSAMNALRMLLKE
jgi:prenylcysteine oxidase/farnesylcysteine lyase